MQCRCCNLTIGCAATKVNREDFSDLKSIKQYRIDLLHDVVKIRSVKVDESTISYITLHNNDCVVLLLLKHTIEKRQRLVIGFVTNIAQPTDRRNL